VHHASYLGPLEVRPRYRRHSRERAPRYHHNSREPRHVLDRAPRQTRRLRLHVRTVGCPRASLKLVSEGNGSIASDTPTEFAATTIVFRLQQLVVKAPAMGIPSRSRREVAPCRPDLAI
jgi:hypothetical protein